MIPKEFCSPLSTSFFCVLLWLISTAYAFAVVYAMNAQYFACFFICSLMIYFLDYILFFKKIRNNFRVSNRCHFSEHRMQKTTLMEFGQGYTHAVRLSILVVWALALGNRV